MYRILLMTLCFLLSCVHRSELSSDEREKRNIMKREDHAFDGNYLSFPKGTILRNNETILFTSNVPANIRTSREALVQCKLFRRAVTEHGVKRLYKIEANTAFVVQGVESDMPMDQGEAKSIPKAGRLLILRIEDADRRIQDFGLGCARTGKSIPEDRIKATILKESFDTESFKDVEIVP